MTVFIKSQTRVLALVADLLSAGAAVAAALGQSMLSVDCAPWRASCEIRIVAPGDCNVQLGVVLHTRGRVAHRYQHQTLVVLLAAHALQRPIIHPLQHLFCVARYGTLKMCSREPDDTACRAANCLTALAVTVVRRRSTLLHVCDLRRLPRRQVYIARVAAPSPSAAAGGC